MPETADLLWWIFLVTFLAVILLVSGLAVGMVRAQHRTIALHRSHLQQLVKAHEDERSRIARDVHDDAVQRLALIGRELELLRGDEQDFANHKLHHLGGIQSEVRDLADALRQLAHQLHPATLEHAGLNVALCQLAEEVSHAHRMCVRAQVPDSELAFDPETRLALFRIAQEAVSNAVRHGRTNEINVRLESDSAGVRLQVDDTGIGFDIRTPPHRGIGLVAMEERARLAGAEAEIHSTPGVGTRVVVRLKALGASS